MQARGETSELLAVLHLAAAIVILLIGLCVLFFSPRLRTRGRFQFGLASVFGWTTLAAIWMFFAVRSLPAALLIASAGGYVLGFTWLLNRYEEVRPSALAKLAILAYATMVPWIILSTLGTWIWRSLR